MLQHSTRLLVVEDEVLILDFLQAVLEDGGFDVEVAAGGVT